MKIPFLYLCSSFLFCLLPLACNRVDNDPKANVDEPKDPTEVVEKSTDSIDLPAAETPPAADPEAQRKLESQSYYTEENITEANAVIEKFTPETREAILEAMRSKKKIEAVKLARAAEKTGLAVSKLIVEMMAISAGIDPGIY